LSATVEGADRVLLVFGNTSSSTSSSEDEELASSTATGSDLERGRGGALRFFGFGVENLTLLTFGLVVSSSES
jgi:hypothetical protein